MKLYLFLHYFCPFYYRAQEILSPGYLWFIWWCLRETESPWMHDPVYKMQKWIQILLCVSTEAHSQAQIRVRVGTYSDFRVIKTS